MKQNDPTDKQRTIACILIATDGSGGARAAIDEGLNLATALGASVLFAAVRHAPLPVLGDPYYQRELSKELHKAEAAAHQAVEAAAKAGVEAAYEVLEGDAADKILTLARTRDADLIVMGSRGRGRVKGALLGSVSSAVVHGADRPVVIVNERARIRRPRAARAEAAS